MEQAKLFTRFQDNEYISLLGAKWSVFRITRVVTRCILQENIIRRAARASNNIVIT